MDCNRAVVWALFQERWLKLYVQVRSRASKQGNSRFLHIARRKTTLIYKIQKASARDEWSISEKIVILISFQTLPSLTSFRLLPGKRDISRLRGARPQLFHYQVLSDNYCPISLTSQTAKILSIITLQRIRAVFSSAKNIKPVFAPRDRSLAKFIFHIRFQRDILNTAASFTSSSLIS